jgi:hypothetical protein
MAMVDPDRQRTTAEAGLTTADFLDEPFIKVDLSRWAARQSSWRKHPIRRFNAWCQDLQLRLGENLLEAFPFLRGPSEWLERKMRGFRL